LKALLRVKQAHLIPPMSCKAIKPNFKHCRNWACSDNGYCSSHKSYSSETHKERWFKRYILGIGQPLPFYWSFAEPQDQNVKEIVRALKAGEIQLSKEDIQKIPNRDLYIDVYTLLVLFDLAKPSDHPLLLGRSLLYYLRFLSTGARLNTTTQVIRQSLILSTGQYLLAYLQSIPIFLKKTPEYLDLFLRDVPTMLDSEAAKELSWRSRQELDVLRMVYEGKLGVDHPLTKTLVQRWLPDIKELYQTEKAIQKCKMDQCKEELMMNRWHPDRVGKYLLMGIDVEDM